MSGCVGAALEEEGWELPEADCAGWEASSNFFFAAASFRFLFFSAALERLASSPGFFRFSAGSSSSCSLKVETWNIEK